MSTNDVRRVNVFREAMQTLRTLYPTTDHWRPDQVADAIRRADEVWFAVGDHICEYPVRIYERAA